MKSTVEQEQYSGYCFFCGAPSECEHHLLFGNGIRPLAEQDGIKVHACSRCHNIGPVTERIHDNPMAEKLSRMLGQALYERNECAKGETPDGAREKFRERYGKSWW